MRDSRRQLAVKPKDDVMPELRADEAMESPITTATTTTAAAPATAGAAKGYAQSASAVAVAPPPDASSEQPEEVVVTGMRRVPQSMRNAQRAGRRGFGPE